jgi:outer membrane receptor for ferrienterochelin and colicin
VYVVTPALVNVPVTVKLAPASMLIAVVVAANSRSAKEDAASTSRVIVSTAPANSKSAPAVTPLITKVSLSVSPVTLAAL